MFSTQDRMNPYGIACRMTNIAAKCYPILPARAKRPLPAPSSFFIPPTPSSFLGLPTHCLSHIAPEAPLEESFAMNTQPRR
jgi:hypothetical protein